VRTRHRGPRLAPDQAVILEIVIPGNPVSGNHAKMPTGHGRQVRAPESRAYDRRIASIALAAVTTARWKMPDFVCCDVTNPDRIEWPEKSPTAAHRRARPARQPDRTVPVR
jgi:hypothetical protein